VGIEYLIVNLEADRELEAVEVFASEVVKRLWSPRRQVAQSGCAR